MSGKYYSKKQSGKLAINIKSKLTRDKIMNKYVQEFGNRKMGKLDIVEFSRQRPGAPPASQRRPQSNPRIPQLKLAIVELPGGTSSRVRGRPGPAPMAKIQGPVAGRSRDHGKQSGANVTQCLRNQLRQENGHNTGRPIHPHKVSHRIQL